MHACRKSQNAKMSTGGRWSRKNTTCDTADASATGCSRYGFTKK
jgi:hypothetical protein